MAFLHLLRSVPSVSLLASSPVSAASVRHAYVYFFHDTPWAQVSTPGLRWGPYNPQMTYLQVQLDGRATVVFLKTLRCPVWGPSPVYSFHKCLYDKTLVPSLHDWEVWRLLKVYSIGIMKSKSSLPLFSDYWHRWMVLLSYVHKQWYSQSVPRHWTPQHTHFFLFFCLLFEMITFGSPGGHKLALAQNLQLSSCPYLPSATILGSCSL